MIGKGSNADLGISFDATISRVYGGYSSEAERLTVAQDVVGSIPTSRPKKLADMDPLKSARRFCQATTTL
jgi:hypothetical protein